MFIIDSCVLIGAKRERDRWHYLARPILEYIAKGKAGVGYLLDYVLIEFGNFLLRKDGVEVAVDAISDILSTRYLKLVVVDEIGLLAAVEIMKKYKGLSLTDATIVYYAKYHNIEYIISFDSRFDIVPWVTRISNIEQLKSIMVTHKASRIKPKR